MTAARRLAVVTGGTRGIGRAITARLLADGHDVLATGTSPTAPAGLPDGARYYGVDLANWAAADLFTATVATARPQILVNNAGINVKGSTAGFPVDTYDLLLDVNLRGPFLLARAALPGMVDAGWGRIVNITSMWGVAGSPLDAAYCASKSGLAGLTMSVAAEVARHGVLVNAVAPGYIHTEAAEAAFSAEELEAVAARVPVGRLGRPEEVAALVAWLAGEENTYLTGQHILIDGGLTRTVR